MNVFQYSAMEQAKFDNVMAELGYKTFTTFFGDLSIAEWYGQSGVKETYGSVVANWSDDIKWFTEFVMALNHKIWEHYETKPALAKVYDELWRKADALVAKKFKDDKEALAYYYATTD